MHRNPSGREDYLGGRSPNQPSSSGTEPTRIESPRGSGIDLPFCFAVALVLLYLLIGDFRG